MDARPIRNPRRVFGVWLGFLAAGTAAAIAFNVWVVSYADELRARDPRTYIERAVELIGKRDLPGAEAQVREALRLAPDSPEAWGVFGNVRYFAKDWSGALETYRGAVERGSTALDVRLHTVWALIELQRYDEAARSGVEALDRGYEHRALHRYVAEALFRAGRRAEAVPHLERALKGFPNDLYLMDHLRQAYAAAGRNDEAKAVAARIAEAESALARGAAEP